MAPAFGEPTSDCTPAASSESPPACWQPTTDMREPTAARGKRRHGFTAGGRRFVEVDTRRLQEAVATHPGEAHPLEEEYSRCLDPGKYRILPARGEAWVRALTRLGVATVDEVVDPAAAWRDEPDVRVETATRLRPTRAGAISLLLGFTSLQGVPAAVVVIGAGQPEVPLVTLPDCGCDACDSGSMTCWRSSTSTSARGHR